MRDKVVRALLDRFRAPNPVSVVFEAYASTFRMMTGRPQPTWYERHRERWVKDGDVTELYRMLRHVEC